ncbi:ArsR family transcriptional regulator, partial [Streptomyces sp. UNOC14_S4]|uniref:ArsR family transcriptional regulator n=1 Tax=Streptomyces sp. UNOC14_S4 TaxID=2872340 RepID=UPI001E5ECD11
AFETVLRPVWGVVQDLHRAEFTRHALTAAAHGAGAALTEAVPGSRLHGDGGVWEVPAPGERDVAAGGRGLVLVPTFHGTGHPVLAEPPDGGPLFLTYPAGPGLPPAATAADGPEDALAAVLGRTRLGVLLLLAEEHTTGGLARRLRVSDATASAHAAALRGAGLVGTVRAGKAVLHRRTPLGDLLVRGLPRPPTAAAGRSVPPASPPGPGRPG